MSRFLVFILAVAGNLAAADHLLKITPETVAWGYYWAAAKPVLTINSGDTVTVECVSVGNPSAPGPYTIRVKVPAGVKLMPHKHSEDRVYTVISGVFYIGIGDRFDADQLQAFPPGAVVVLPGDTFHFHWAKSSEYVTQVTAIGPLGLDYLNPDDDPRNQGKNR